VNSRDVNGIAVISIADGARLGTIERAYLDPAAKRLAGFAARSGGGLLGAAPDRGLVIDVDEVHSLGPDALTLDRTDAAHRADAAADYGDLLPLEGLSKLKVVTDGGTYIGQVVSADFDERTFDLTEIEASPGFFQANRRIPIDQVITIGVDVVVVTNAVGQKDTTPDAATAPQTPETVTAPGVTVHESRSVIVGEGFSPAETAAEAAPDRLPAEDRPAATPS
jgi:uncharacterized protein YrrD